MFLSRYIHEFVRWQLAATAGMCQPGEFRTSLEDFYACPELGQLCSATARCMATQVCLVINSAAFLTISHTRIFPCRTVDLDLTTGFPVCAADSKSFGYFGRSTFDVDYEQPGGVIEEWIRALCLDDDELISTFQLALGSLLLGLNKTDAPIVALAVTDGARGSEFVDLVQIVLRDLMSTSANAIVNTGFVYQRVRRIRSSLGVKLVSGLLQAGAASKTDASVRTTFLYSDVPLLTSFSAHKIDITGDIAHPRLALLYSQTVFTVGDDPPLALPYNTGVTKDMRESGVLRAEPTVSLWSLTGDRGELTWLFTWMVRGARRCLNSEGGLARALASHLKKTRACENRFAGAEEYT